MNRRHNLTPFPYVSFMQEHYGPGVVEELHSLRLTPRKVTDEELRQKLARYRAL